MEYIFKYETFADVDIDDPFFRSLKEDYPDFETWYRGKAQSRTGTYTLRNPDRSVGGFLYIKQHEHESIVLEGKTLPEKNRTKIGTFKIGEDNEGSRYGEGAMAIALWTWRDSEDEEIYVTVFPKQQSLIELLVFYGFELAGTKPNEECVYLRSNKRINKNQPYVLYPFAPQGRNAGMLAIEPQYHDKLFPYGTLRHTNQNVERIPAGNGIKKIYIGFPFSEPAFKKGDMVFIYRKSVVDPIHKSVITSFCLVSDMFWVKRSGRALFSIDDYLKHVGNKSVFSAQELEDFYSKKENLLIFELLYLGSFGEGNNVNCQTLKNEGYWAGNVHPYQIQFSPAQTTDILSLGRANPTLILM